MYNPVKSVRLYKAMKAKPKQAAATKLGKVIGRLLDFELDRGAADADC